MKIVKSSCGGKKRVRTCTLSPQVNIKNKRESIQTQEDINAAYSEAKIQDLVEDLKNVIWMKVSNVATSDSFGFDEDEVNDYFFVDVTPTEIGENHQEAVRVEVRAEVSYDGLEKLMEALNPIIESYDSYAYFEPVEPGIIEAYVSVDQVDMSVYGGSEYGNSSQSQYTNRVVLRYKNKSFTIYDNSDSINLPADADLEALRKWKAQITQQAGAYNDADEDYEWASLSNGVVSYYRRGKLVDKSYYMSPSDWDVETLGEWSESVIYDVIENLYEANRDVPDRMVYNSTDIEASSDDSIMFEGDNYEYVTNNHGYWIYRAVIDGKGVWRAMKQGSDESQFGKLSFPISYEQARGFEPINEPSAITKLRKDLGKKLLSKSGRSVEATTEYLDIGGILGEPNARYSSEDLRSIYEEEKHHDPLTYIYEKGKHHDPLISQYDSYESWFKDIEQYLYEIYSDTEDITSSTDDKVFIEDILDGLEDNGYDLNDLSSIKEGLWALFGYQGKDANDVIEDLVAGGFIDSNVLIDSGRKSIYSDEIESSESVAADAFSSLENQYLSPPEYDDPIEHEDSQELIEVELDQVITVDVDGDYEWDDDTYVWASPDGSNEEWRSEDGVYIDDKVGVVEHIDDLIIPNVPTRPGKYRVTGLAELIYDVSGIQEYRTNYGPDDYESDLDTDHAVVSFNFSKSSVENLKITPVRR